MRPQPRRRAIRLAGLKGSQRLRVRGLLIAIAAAAGMALFYLSQSGHVAATGYEIDRLQALLADRRAEQQQLILEIGRATSPAEIARRARDQLHLVPLPEGAVRFAPSSIDTSP